MKRFLFVLSAAIISLAANAQVVVTFSNFGVVFNSGSPFPWSAPITDELGTPLSGSLYKADLTYDAVPWGGTGYESVPASASFLNTGNGRFFGGDRTISIDADPGDTVTLIIRAWYDPDGTTTYEMASRRGQSDPFPITAVDTTAVPPPLPIQLSSMSPFALAIPEPADTALLGAAAAMTFGLWMRWARRPTSCRRFCSWRRHG